jgi:oligogalacturonide lyase
MPKAKVVMALAFRKGAVFPSEAKEMRDERTGAFIVQLTAHESINHHLYPLACSTTPEVGWVIFASNRSGTWQFYKARFPQGEIVQLTDDPQGVNGYSGHISPDGTELLFTAHGEIRAVNLETLRERTIARWDSASLGEVNLSKSGEWLVTAMKWQGRNYLAVAKTDGSKADLIFESERTLIHPQFCPADETLIEYAQDPAPRMWLIRRDGSGNTCLYEHGNDEFIVHETWLGERLELVFVHWRFSLKRMTLGPAEPVPQPSGIVTIAELNAWHIAPNKAGNLIICDTNHPDIGLLLVEVQTGQWRTLCYPQASCQGTQWLQTRYATKEDFERAGKEDWALSWMEAKVDTVYGPQWTHPHPSWSADERWVIYGSDVSGTTQVYAALVAEI